MLAAGGVKALVAHMDRARQVLADVAARSGVEGAAAQVLKSMRLVLLVVDLTDGLTQHQRKVRGEGCGLGG